MARAFELVAITCAFLWTLKILQAIKVITKSFKVHVEEIAVHVTVDPQASKRGLDTK